MLKQAIGHGGLFLRKAKRKTRTQPHLHNGAVPAMPASPINTMVNQPSAATVWC